jgi:hypothetical protein
VVKPIHLDRSAVEAQPYLSWNAFVDVVSLSSYNDLTPIQRVAHLAFWYESEVQNGGHLQYFENQGTSRLAEVVSALEAIGAPEHAEVLKNAAAQYQASQREPLSTAEEFVDAGLDAEFEPSDSAFGECQPNLQEALERYLQENLAVFVDIA